jgi:hypothetical protein
VPMAQIFDFEPPQDALGATKKWTFTQLGPSNLYRRLGQMNVCNSNVSSPLTMLLNPWLLALTIHT